jgi:hypothetical protein
LKSAICLSLPDQLEFLDLSYLSAMKTIHDILKLGDPRLYQVCEPVLESELDQVSVWTLQLHEAMEDIRRVYGFGTRIKLDKSLSVLRSN